jgi:hypothetical protein
VTQMVIGMVMLHYAVIFVMFMRSLSLIRTASFWFRAGKIKSYDFENKALRKHSLTF